MKANSLRNVLSPFWATCRRSMRQLPMLSTYERAAQRWPSSKVGRINAPREKLSEHARAGRVAPPEQSGQSPARIFRGGLVRAGETEQQGAGEIMPNVTIKLTTPIEGPI